MGYGPAIAGVARPRLQPVKAPLVANPAMRFWLLLSVALSVLSPAAEAAVTSALPQANDNSWDLCRDTSKIAAIAACSDLINGAMPLSSAQLAEAHYYRGSTYFRSGNPMTALADLDRALALDSTIIGAYIIRGAARAQIGDLDSAISDFNAALEARPNDPLILVDRARTFAAKGDLGHATADVTVAIMIDPTFAFAIAVRGALYEVQGNTRDALADFRAALAIDPTIGIAQQGIARLAH